MFQFFKKGSYKYSLRQNTNVNFSNERNAFEVIQNQLKDNCCKSNILIMGAFIIALVFFY